MKRGMALFAFWFLISLTSLGQLVSAQENGYEEELVQGNTQFAIDLYKRIKTQEGNLFFSPYSVSTALAMAYGGARGETAKQMANVLHFTLENEKMHSSFAEIETRLNAIQQKEKIQLSIANSLWPQDKYPFLKEYLELTKSYYQSEITPVDYTRNSESARLKINTWVENATNNRIRDIIPDTKPPFLPPLATLVLVNAIYFKGQWASQFEVSATTDMPFYYEKDRPTTVSMMNQTHGFKYREDDILQVLEMPYTGHELSMVILLPKEMDGLSNVEELLAEHSLTEWSKNLYERPVNVFLPRLTMTSPLYDLKNVLAEMGMRDAFVFRKANFSGMDGNPNWLYIEFVLHKAFVEINEEGNEAAAATAVGCFPSGTEVLTDRGLYPIETVGSGTKVYACDLTTGEWVLAKIVRCQSALYEGDMITIQINHDSIQATGNQPFYVLRGHQLGSRPRPQEVPKEEESEIQYGRWVEARDLKEGDVLQGKSGGDLTVTLVSRRKDKARVYCLDVEKYHNCAVHRLGILAHNAGKKEIVTPPSVFKADHPFLFLIQDNATRSILFMARVSNPSIK